MYLWKTITLQISAWPCDCAMGQIGKLQKASKDLLHARDSEIVRCAVQALMPLRALESFIISVTFPAIASDSDLTVLAGKF